MNFIGFLRSSVAAAVLALAASQAGAEGTFDIPPGAHFDPKKLEKIGEFFRNEISTGKIPGAILLIQQHGKPVYHEFFGVRDPATKEPMTDDTIFQIFSMSKPITSVAAMTLIDQHKIKIDDPVGIYIPEFSTAKVGVEKKTDNGEKALELQPLKRPITILDLMTQTSGITYGFYGDSMVQRPTPTPGSTMAISPTPNSPNASRHCRWPSSPAHCGITGIRPTFLAASSKSPAASRCCNMKRKACSIRSA
jgi:CubicO group peptidase (beta-lactamase class C family)